MNSQKLTVRQFEGTVILILDSFHRDCVGERVTALRGAHKHMILQMGFRELEVDGFG